MQNTGDLTKEFQHHDKLDVHKISRYELHAHKMVYYVADMFKRKMPGFENSTVAHIGVDFALRSSRFIHGREVLDASMVENAEEPTFFDSVIATLPVRDREYECGGFFKSITYDIPCGITVPKGCEDLLVASGKTVGTDSRALIRGMPACMVCGQGAGAAAAVAVGAGVSVADVDVREAQKTLLGQGAYPGEKPRLKELGLA